MAKKAHWGDWIIARSRVVGFRTQRQLAAAVGCRHEQLSRWAQMTEPPTEMRKGFDRALAHALKVDRLTLFKYWEEMPAEDTPLIETPSPQQVPWEAFGRPGDEDVRLLIERVCDHLHGADLQDVQRFAMNRLAQKMREQQSQIKEIMKRLKLPPSPESDEEIVRGVLESMDILPPAGSPLEPARPQKPKRPPKS